MNICIFCSAQKLEEKYTEPAKEFARFVGKNGHSLVWGGVNKGLMGLIADAAKKEGGRLVGVSMEMFQHVEYKDAHEMMIVKTLGERKAAMLDKADVLVMMVGGIGTLDELTEVLELKKHGAHVKPIVVLNTEHFYEGFQKQLQRMQDDNFLPRPYSDFIYFANTPKEAMQYIEGCE